MQILKICASDLQNSDFKTNPVPLRHRFDLGSTWHGYRDHQGPSGTLLGLEWKVWRTKNSQIVISLGGFWSCRRAGSFQSIREGQKCLEQIQNSRCNPSPRLPTHRLPLPVYRGTKDIASAKQDSNIATPHSDLRLFLGCSFVCTSVPNPLPIDQTMSTKRPTHYFVVVCTLKKC